MSGKKLIIASFMLLFLLAVGSTMAFITDTDSKTNKFSFGNVEVTITEPNWVPANGLNVVPGQTIAKDPLLTNTGSTNAYVFLEVAIPCVNNKPVMVYTVNSGWALVNSDACTYGQMINTYVYGTTTTATVLAPNASTPTLFDSVTINTLANYEVQQFTGDFDVNVYGYGTQADGINTESGHSSDPNTLLNNFIQ